MAGFKTLNGKPVNMETERAWYDTVCRLHGIDKQKDHIMLVPAENDADCMHWAVVHGETMTEINSYDLDEGETVADVLAHVRACMPGAEVRAPRGML